MIKLEGGSDFDLTVLDLPDPEEERKDLIRICFQVLGLGLDHQSKTHRC